MYEIIKSVIEAKQYELSAMLQKIDTIWVQGEITDDQRTELITLARDKADPANSYAPLQEQITNLYALLDALTSRVTVLESGDSSGSEPEEPTDPDDEWPEYVQPTGAHDAYKTGDKVTYNGNHYICKMDGCVWDPDTYPAAWKDAEEAETAE